MIDHNKFETESITPLDQTFDGSVINVPIQPISL